MADLPYAMGDRRPFPRPVRARLSPCNHTYLYHTHHWRLAASYVALTRQRESAQVFVARGTARDAPQLARQMARRAISQVSADVYGVGRYTRGWNVS